MGVQPVRLYRAPKITGPQKISLVVEGPMYSSEARPAAPRTRLRKSAALVVTSRVWRQRDASCSSDHLVSGWRSSVRLASSEAGTNDRKRSEAEAPAGLKVLFFFQYHLYCTCTNQILRMKV